jgi:hypothetical protein
MSQTMSAPACLMNNSPKLPQCVVGPRTLPFHHQEGANELLLSKVCSEGQASAVLLATILDASEELVVLKERTHCMCSGLVGEQYALRYDIALDLTMPIDEQIECAEEDGIVPTLTFEQTKDATMAMLKKVTLIVDREIPPSAETNA